MAQVVIVDSGEPNRKQSRWWLWLLIPIIIILVAIGAFVLWALTPFGNPMPEALLALESDEEITVSTNAWIAFVPNEIPPTTGLILYPGAKVPAEAYAPLARKIAVEGYLVVIVYPPLNLAIFNPNIAEPVIQHFSAIEHWIVGGHSLGGTAAASYTSSHPEQIDGIVFLGSYPSNDRLKEMRIAVLSIYASNDGVTSVNQIEASKQNLPVNTHFVEIIGGNHAQFGYYGTQGGDGEATISRDEQIGQTVEAILNFLRLFGK